MFRTLVFVAVFLALACSRPRAIEPAQAPAPSPAAAPGAPVATDPARLLDAATLSAYLDHLVPLGVELAGLDPVFAARYQGTAVTWKNLVDPKTQAERDALAVRHGYASWAAFSAVHDKVVGAMGLAVARVLRGMSVAANSNRMKELAEQASDSKLAPDQKARLDATLAEMKKRGEDLKTKALGRTDVPEENVVVLAARHEDLTRRFRDLREALRARKGAALGAPATPPAAPAPAPSAPSAVPASTPAATPVPAPAPTPSTAPTAPIAPGA